MTAICSVFLGLIQSRPPDDVKLLVLASYVFQHSLCVHSLIPTDAPNAAESMPSAEDFCEALRTKQYADALRILQPGGTPDACIAGIRRMWQQDNSLLSLFESLCTGYRTVEKQRAEQQQIRRAKLIRAMLAHKLIPGSDPKLRDPYAHVTYEKTLDQVYTTCRQKDFPHICEALMDHSSVDITLGMEDWENARRVYTDRILMLMIRHPRAQLQHADPMIKQNLLRSACHNLFPDSLRHMLQDARFSSIISDSKVFEWLPLDFDAWSRPLQYKACFSILLEDRRFDPAYDDGQLICRVLRNKMEDCIPLLLKEGQIDLASIGLHNVLRCIFWKRALDTLLRLLDDVNFDIGKYIQTSLVHGAEYGRWKMLQTLLQHERVLRYRAHTYVPMFSVVSSAARMWRSLNTFKFFLLQIDLDREAIEDADLVKCLRDAFKTSNKHVRLILEKFEQHMSDDVVLYTVHVIENRVQKYSQSTTDFNTCCRQHFLGLLSHIPRVVCMAACTTDLLEAMDGTLYHQCVERMAGQAHACEPLFQRHRPHTHALSVMYAAYSEALHELRANTCIPEVCGDIQLLCDAYIGTFVPLHVGPNGSCRQQREADMRALERERRAQGKEEESTQPSKRARLELCS